MSKDLHFEIMSLVEMPRSLFQKLKQEEEFEQIRLLKHIDPSHKGLYENDKEWIELERTRKECREEQKEIESKLRVDANIRQAQKNFTS